MRVWHLNGMGCSGDASFVSKLYAEPRGKAKETKFDNALSGLGDKSERLSIGREAKFCIQQLGGRKTV